MKKFLTFVLVLAMVMSVSSVAMAASQDPCTSDPCAHAAYIATAHYDTLQEAITAAQNGDTVTLLADCDENVTVTQKPDVKITIDGNGKTMTGTITVDGMSATIQTAGVTIKNFKFDAVNINSAVYDACIRMGDGTNPTRYVCNVKVEGCTFTDSGTVKTKDVVAIKSYTGGDYNLTVTGCKATKMHSLMQLKNVVEGLTIENCSVTEGKNGISLGCSEAGVTITGCTINVEGYGIRIGALGSPYNSDITIRDTEITAEQPVVARGKDVAGKLDLDVNDENNKFESEDNYPIVVTSGDDGTDADDEDFAVPNEEGINIKGAKRDIPGGYIMAYEPPAPESKPSSGSGIDVEYEGGNSFSTSKSDVPTGVEIDGVPVTFNGTGKFFTVGCIDPSAEWVTVRWNSTSVTVNFKPDVNVVCAEVAIPKTGDMPIFAAVAAFFGF